MLPFLARGLGGVDQFLTPRKQVPENTLLLNTPLLITLPFQWTYKWEYVLYNIMQVLADLAWRSTQCKLGKSTYQLEKIQQNFVIFSSNWVHFSKKNDNFYSNQFILLFFLRKLQKIIVFFTYEPGSTILDKMNHAYMLKVKRSTTFFQNSR